jgi:hypothetical protein
MNSINIDGKYYSSEVADEIFKLRAIISDLDLRQLTKKIQLNSAYGALLAKMFRWAVDEKLGASTTYTGRAITTHMTNEAAELLTGENASLRKEYELDKDKVKNIYIADNQSIIYSDTDSAYFVTGVDNIDDAVLIADGVGEALNESFIGFMRAAFLCQPNYDNIIKAGREIVAERALFQARKKYMAKVVDLEGFRVNKIKAMGSEIKKSDTPKIIQHFLKETVDKILDGVSYDDVCKFVNEQRKFLFTDVKPSELILLGVVKSANNLEHFTDAERAESEGTPFKAKNGKSKLTIPGHVKAAIYFNKISEAYDGKSFQRINNGDKVRIFEVLPNNEYGISAIALPAEATKFPIWFFEKFQINMKISEEKLICNKLEGVFSAMGLDIPTPQSVIVNSLIDF